MKQRCRGNHTGNKYDLLRAKHRYNTMEKVHQGTGVENTAHHIELLAKNMQGKHKSNLVIEPTTGSYLEYMHLIKVPTRSIWENLFANEIDWIAQGVGKRIP